LNRMQNQPRMVFPKTCLQTYKCFSFQKVLTKEIPLQIRTGQYTETTTDK